jgi:hypothetical protein
MLGSPAYSYRKSPHQAEFTGDEDDTIDSYQDMEGNYFTDFQMDEDDDYYVAERPENPMSRKLLDESINDYTTDESHLNGTFTTNYSMDSTSAKQFYCPNFSDDCYLDTDSDYDSDDSDIAIINGSTLDLSKKRNRTNTDESRSGSSLSASMRALRNRSRVTKNRFISYSDHLNIMNYESHIASQYSNDFEDCDEIISSSPISASRTLLCPVDAMSNQWPSNLCSNVENLNNLQMNSE